MKNKLRSLRTVVIFFVMSYSLLLLFFYFQNKQYQARVNSALGILSETNRSVSFLGIVIRQCQIQSDTYCQTFDSDDYQKYENQTYQIYESLKILAKQTSTSNDCLLFSRVIYQINEAQQDFIKTNIVNKAASSDLFEYIRTLRLIFSEMNEAYAQYLNAYLQLNNTQWLSIQQNIHEFKNLQMISWWLISIFYWCIFFFIIRNLFEKNRAEKELLRQKQVSNEARLQMLQMQINPHFLFNTLNLIIHAIQEGAPNTAVQLIKATSELLRKSIEISQKHIPLSTELDLLRTYLIIFQERFQGHIQLELDIDQIPPSTMIPPFIIQPLIENAIKHGLNEQIDNAYIHIMLKDCAQYTLLSVTDNGVGAPSDLLRQILEGRISGTGIKNIYERLYLLCNDPDVMTIATTPNQGTTVNIKLYKGDCL